MHRPQCEILWAKRDENMDVECKDNPARRWCEGANELTGVSWRYLKVRQKEFDALQPSTLLELQAIDEGKTGLFT